MTTELKNTELGASYWNGTGVYQQEYEKLYDELVPFMGEAKTVNGELVRAASRLFYDYCNNGNMNAREIEYGETEEPCNCEDDDCDICGGCGYIYEEEETDVKVSEFYEGFLQFISKHLMKKMLPKQVGDIIEGVRSVITNYSESQSYFRDSNVQKYNRLVDAVMWYILNTENEPLV